MKVPRRGHLPVRVHPEVLSVSDLVERVNKLKKANQKLNTLVKDILDEKHQLIGKLMRARDVHCPAHKVKEDSVMAKRHQYVYAEGASVKWVCVSCNHMNNTNATTFESVGGCGGHGAEEYCYCPSRETELWTKCEKCNISTTVKVG